MQDLGPWTVDQGSGIVPPPAGADAPRPDLVLVDAKTVQAAAQDDPEDKSAPDTAQTILGEYIDRCRKRPPNSVVGQMAKQIKGLLKEDFDPDIIRRGIAQWMTKELHPSVLPSIVNSLVNRSASTGTEGVNGIQGYGISADTSNPTNRKITI